MTALRETMTREREREPIGTETMDSSTRRPRSIKRKDEKVKIATKGRRGTG